jgi:hypothetical protein
VVASYSSTALEALAFEKPLVRISHQNKIDVSPFNPASQFHDAEFVQNVQSDSELINVLEDNTANATDVADFLKQFFYRPDDKSKQRVAARLVELHT